MKIAEMISITELSRLIGKSRPTVYKYISDYENNEHDQVPSTLLTLFERIEKENITKAEVYSHCEKYYSTTNTNLSTLDEIIQMLKEHREKLDLLSLKNQIKKEIEEYGK